MKKRKNKNKTKRICTTKEKKNKILLLKHYKEDSQKVYKIEKEEISAIINKFENKEFDLSVINEY